MGFQIAILLATHIVSTCCKAVISHLVHFANVVAVSPTTRFIAFRETAFNSKLRPDIAIVIQLFHIGDFILKIEL